MNDLKDGRIRVVIEGIAPQIDGGRFPIKRTIGSEEYLDSEKYEIKRWDTGNPASLKDFIGRVNEIRRENRALQSDARLRFHNVDNERIICYSKHTEDLSNVVLVVVNLDPHHAQSGWVEFPASELGLNTTAPFQVIDLLTGARYPWSGSRNYVELDPRVVPVHIFRIARKMRTERDFDYYG